MNIVVTKPRDALAVNDAKAFCDDVLAGLQADPKRVPPKYFYDETGSHLFQRITALPEYYLTRTETGILERHADAIAQMIPPEAAMVEFGAGSSAKTRILLRAAPHVSTYVPVDISGAYLAAETALLRQEMPNLQVLPVAADFTRPFALPQTLGNGPRVGFFPGSTIGNFEPHEANALLRHAATILGPGALFIIGVDLVKDVNVLTAAYNDATGVTAAFNLNLLTRINRELGGGFDLGTFRHRAWYNAEQHRVEMHLVSLAKQKVRACGKSFEFWRGESIHTENSYKYTVESFRSRALGAGWTHAATFVDEQDYFSVHALRANGAAKAS
ncbi:MAG: L-histidine N(alpha)-methyltransferase [Alphaproteobacteria bacterium]|nr:L-histidine N(alpha)-methyltransferase [Alphaproteobacteria bacterium]